MVSELGNGFSFRCAEMRLRHLNALRAVETVLRRGSLAAAADEMGVTPAAVAQQVRTLEAALGRALFARRPGGLVPSADARAAAPRLTSALSTLSEILAELDARDEDRRLGVTLPESFAENWFTPRVSGFFAHVPGVDLRLDASNRRQDLAGSAFQFAIRYAPPPEAGLAHDDLFGDCVLPVCAPEFALRHGLSPDRPSLDAVPLIHLDNRTPDPDWADWPTWCACFGVTFEPAATGMRFSRVASGLQAALSGQGLVLCGLVEASEAVSSGRLVVPFGLQRSVATGYRYRLLWLRDRRFTPVQEAFRTWVVDIAQSFAASAPTLQMRGG